MSGGKLEVQIGADKTDFDKKIKEVEYDIKELSKVKLNKLKLGLDTTEINSQIKDAKNNLTQLKTAVKDTGQSFTGMAPKVANGGNALMQFSRIAQDAPYGIIGIGNNITATVEAFGHLKASTGSTGGALKALGSSILGSGGILLGVSLLTTGLTYMAQSGLSVSDVINKLTGKFDALSAEMQKANAEAAKTAGSEVASMKALVSVAQDETKSRQDRLIAVKELQKEFPAYFGNLSTEKILNGNLTSVTKELTKAIIERAKASAYASKIGELASEELIITEKLIKAQEALAKGVLLPARGGATRGSISAAYTNLKNTVADIGKELAENRRKQDVYTEAINKSTSASIKLKDEVTKTPKAKVVKDKTHADFKPEFIAPFIGTISGLGDTMDGFEERTRIAFQNATGTVKTQTDAMTKALEDFNSAAKEIILGNIAETFVGLGQAIGSALASGGNVLKAVGQSLLSSLGNLLTDMGKMAIQVGVGLIAIKRALSSLNPAVAIGAGVALIALGSFFSSKASSIGGGIGGGGASGSSGSGANNSSFTSSGFASRGDGGGTVVFEIAGQKLIGVLSNTLNANKRLGGQIGL